MRLLLLLWLLGAARVQALESMWDPFWLMSNPVGPVMVGGQFHVPPANFGFPAPGETSQELSEQSDEWSDGEASQEGSSTEQSPAPQCPTLVATWGTTCPDFCGDFDIIQSITSKLYVRNQADKVWQACGSSQGPLPQAPIDVPTDFTGGVQIVGGTFFEVVRYADGTVQAFGAFGPSWPPIFLPESWANYNIVSIAASQQAILALTSEGIVLSYGEGPDAKVPSTLLRATAIAAGGETAAAINAETGGVVVWGACTSGICDVPLSAAKEVTQLALGSAHAVVVKKDGTLVLWGDNTYMQLLTPEALHNNLYPVVSVAAGSWHTLAQLSNGQLFAWGLNTDSIPASTVPDEAANGAAGFTAGAFFSAALVPASPAPSSPSPAPEESSAPSGSPTVPDSSPEQASPAPSPEEFSTGPAPTPEESSDNPAPEPEESSTKPAPTPEESSSNSAPAPEESSSNPAPEESCTTPTPEESSTIPAPTPEESSSHRGEASFGESSSTPAGSPAPVPASPVPEESSNTPSPAPSPVSSPEPSPVPSLVPSPIPSPVPSPELSPVPSPEPSPVPSPLPSPVPSPEPSPEMPSPAPEPSPSPAPPKPIPPEFRDFPYCNCVTPQRSPFTIDLSSQQELEHGHRYCFKITAENRPPPCGQFNLGKVEFDIVPGCSFVRDLTFDGRKYATSFATFNNGENIIFKLTGGKKPLVDFDTILNTPSEICFTTMPQCPLPVFCGGDVCKTAFFSMDHKCCPTNGSPSQDVPNARPFGSTFPWCQCDNTVPSPYALTLKSQELEGKVARVCWDLTTHASASASCGQMDLRKIEWNINANCRGTVQAATFDGVSLTPSYAAFNLTKLSKGDGIGLLYKMIRKDSIMNPLARFPDLVGRTVPVCLELRGACSNLADFCVGDSCDIAYYSPSMDCCPLNGGGMA